MSKEEFKKDMEYELKLKVPGKLLPKALNALGIACENIFPHTVQLLEIQEKFFKNSVDLDPSRAVSWLNLGRLEVSRHNYEKAKYYFLKALEHDKDVPVNFSLGCIELQKRNWSKGWELFEYRFKEANSLYPKLPMPLWDCKPTKKSLLIQFDQGYGDAIQFYRYIEKIKKYTGNIVLRVPMVMKDLFDFAGQHKNLFYVADEYAALNQCSYHIPLCSLPYALTCNEQFDPTYKAGGYLKIPKNFKINKIKNSIAVKWHNDPRLHPNRNIPMDLLEPIFNLDYDFISMQFFEKQPPHQKVRMLEKPRKPKNMFDVAIILDACERVITTDCNIAHLAGALGKPTFLLLPFHADWRWHDDKKTTPWYNSIEIIRQSCEGDWRPVIETLKRRLEDGSG